VPLLKANRTILAAAQICIKKKLITRKLKKPFQPQAALKILLKLRA
jgi:hypothetical protein